MATTDTPAPVPAPTPGTDPVADALALAATYRTAYAGAMRVPEPVRALLVLAARVAEGERGVDVLRERIRLLADYAREAAASHRGSGLGNATSASLEHMADKLRNALRPAEAYELTYLAPRPSAGPAAGDVERLALAERQFANAMEGRQSPGEWTHAHGRWLLDAAARASDGERDAGAVDLVDAGVGPHIDCATSGHLYRKLATQGFICTVCGLRSQHGDHSGGITARASDDTARLADATWRALEALAFAMSEGQLDADVAREACAAIEAAPRHRALDEVAELLRDGLATSGPLVAIDVRAYTRRLGDLRAARLAAPAAPEVPRG